MEWNVSVTECFMTLQDGQMVLSKSDYSSHRVISSHKCFINFLYLNLQSHKPWNEHTTYMNITCFYIKINKLNRQWLYLLYNWVALWPVNVYLLYNRKQRRFQIQILTIKILSRTLVSRIQSAYLFQSVLSSVSSQLSRVGRPHQTGLEHQCRGGCKTVGTKRDGGRGWPCFYAQSAGVGQGALLAPVLLRRNYKDSRSRQQTITVLGFVKDNGNQDTFLFWF